MQTRVLTGITTTGTPHLGNYVGAIRPALEASARADVDAFFFMADYHALIKCGDAARVERSRLEIAATWLAAGLDPERVTFYRQSDIPEIPQLTWFLTCIAPKGMLNRAHAYKAAVEQNLKQADDPDAGVSAGLYMYPVLMAADILAFDANQVPVGRDQIQHIEMARDLAQRFNHMHGHDYFVLPEALIDDSVATLPGLDGRKMSKSYDNTVPLFAGGKPALRTAVMRIVTDSRAPGEPKDPDGSALVMIHRAFASEVEHAAFRAALVDGMGWGDAKQALLEQIERAIGPMRERYAQFMADPGAIEVILRRGAEKARAIATPKLAQLRDVLGLRRGVTPVPGQHRAGAPDTTSAKPGKRPRLASFRDEAGAFRWRLFAADGEELLLSRPFADPRQAGVARQQVQTRGADGVQLHVVDGCLTLALDGDTVASTALAGDAATREDAITRLRQALEQLATA